MNVIEENYEAPELSSLKRKAMVDSILRVTSYAAAITAIVAAPNIVQALDKPLQTLDKTMDERKRRRHIMQTIYYMKSRGYLAGDYEHGLQLTPKAKKRLKSRHANQQRIIPSEKWDGTWRIVIYDIPEQYKVARQAFSTTLRRLGCFQLQKSTWITPFACREIVAAAAVEYAVDAYVTYFEADYLDNSRPLIDRFKKKYPLTTFHID